MITNEIKAKIIAKNRVSAYINAKAPAIFAALQPFLGQKVILASGELSAKVKKALEGVSGWFPEEKMQVYMGSPNYSLSFIFKSSEQFELDFGSRSIYSDSIIYFGTVNNGVLTSFDDFSPREQICAEKYLEIREKIYQAEEELQKLKSTLPSL